MRPDRPMPRNRGTPEQPRNRFRRVSYEPDPEAPPDENPSPRTEFLRDASRSAITYNQSDDLGFRASFNPYRGCEHGCIYCYARPTHEYLGFSAGLDFESRILVKDDAPELLRRELSAPRWEPQTVVVSGVTDPYQPIEARLGLTRRSLEVFREFRNPVAVITKNALVGRDIDILRDLAGSGAAAVHLSVTTLRDELWKVLEPRTSRPSRRLETVRALAEAGVPAGVMIAPVIPGLTDSEIPAIVEAAAEAGARSAGLIVLRLPWAVKDLFEDWLDRHFPDRKRKVLSRIRALRSGKLNDPRFGTRMRGEGIFAEQIQKLHRSAVRRHGLDRERVELSTAAFRRPGAKETGGGFRQLELF